MASDGKVRTRQALGVASLNPRFVMKVRDLLDEIEAQRLEYDDFLDWDVYTEQICEMDKAFKKDKKGQNWKWLTGGEGWEYFECVGWWTKFPDKKIFTINVNY